MMPDVDHAAATDDGVSAAGGPLAGLRIVEIPAFVAALIGGMSLAQLGAEVIRIDPIGGNIDYKRWFLSPESDSLYWASLNKGKRSVSLALGTLEGQDATTRHLQSPLAGCHRERTRLSRSQGNLTVS